MSERTEKDPLRDAWRFGRYERFLLTIWAATIGVTVFRIVSITVNQHSTPVPDFKSDMRLAYYVYLYGTFCTFWGRPVSVYAVRLINNHRTGGSSNVD